LENIKFYDGLDIVKAIMSMGNMKYFEFISPSILITKLSKRVIVSSLTSGEPTNLQHFDYVWQKAGPERGPMTQNPKKFTLFPSKLTQYSYYLYQINHFYYYSNKKLLQNKIFYFFIQNIYIFFLRYDICYLLSLFHPQT
jgi:hypothetical protein